MIARKRVITVCGKCGAVLPRGLWHKLDMVVCALLIHWKDCPACALGRRVEEKEEEKTV